MWTALGIGLAGMIAGFVWRELVDLLLDRLDLPVRPRDLHLD